VEPVLWATGLASPVAPAADVPGRVRADGEGPMVPEAAIVVESTDEFVEAIRSNRGAVGVMRTREAMQNELTIVPVERVRHRRNLRLSTLFEAPSRAGAVGGLSYIIVNTIVMVLFVIAICTPIGVSAAVFLVEYAKQGPLLKTLRVATDTLAGVPSIIFGLFGMVFFSEILRLQTGLLAGSLTLTIMILPTVIRTSEEALKAVPRPLRDGSLALGATKLQTIFRVVVPAASPGILTGMILGIGRAVGETAALLFTMGSNLAMVQSLNSPMRVLSVHLYLLIRENISLANAFAAATILVIIVFLVNFTTTRLIGRLNRMANTA
jgi:phosphate transport system permease protein